MAVATRNYNGTEGGWYETGNFALDPASIGANSVGIETVTITGAKLGDIVFVSGETLLAGVIVTGAKVTALNTVSVYLYNPTAGAVNDVSKNYVYFITHLT